jgi:hypothetical protein
MDLLLLISGILLNILAGVDLIFTAFSTQGAGIISSWLPKFIWHLLLKLSGNDGSKPLLSYSALIITISIVAVWVMLAWLGNFLIFTSDPWAVVETKNQLPVSAEERFYYSGYILSTMGNGDYTGGTHHWKLYTAFASFAGLIMITSAITYLIPVFSAFMKEQELSIYITTLGGTPLDILINHWNDTDFGNLSTHFSQLSNKIIGVGQTHQVYPILFYFHENKREKSLPLAISALDECLTMMLLYVKDHQEPLLSEIKHLRYAINSYLWTMHSSFIKPAENIPPYPDPDKLRNSGLPLKALSESPAELYRPFNERRKTLKGLVEAKGWDWEDIEKMKSFGTWYSTELK